MIIVRILTGLRFSFGFRLNISMNSISPISTICIQLITQYQHPTQRFLAKGMVYRHGANVCWTALDGSCLGRASGTCSRKNCWDKLHQQLEEWELTPQGVFFCFFLSHVKSVIHCFDKNGVKTPDGFLCLRLVDGVWPYLTWTSSRHYDQSPSTVAGATPKTIRRQTGLSL